METKQLTTTIPYTLFNQMVISHDLNNQDEVDSFITHVIEDQVTKQAERDAMTEYYQEYKHG